MTFIHKTWERSEVVGKCEVTMTTLSEKPHRQGQMYSVTPSVANGSQERNKDRPLLS